MTTFIDWPFPHLLGLNLNQSLWVQSLMIARIRLAFRKLLTFYGPGGKMNAGSVLIACISFHSIACIQSPSLTGKGVDAEDTNPKKTATYLFKTENLQNYHSRGALPKPGIVLCWCIRHTLYWCQNPVARQEDSGPAQAPARESSTGAKSSVTPKLRTVWMQVSYLHRK